MSESRTSCVSCNGTGDLGGDADLGGCPDCDGVGTISMAWADEAEMVVWLRFASQAIYLATEASVADEISPKLKRAAAMIERLSHLPTQEG